MFDRFKKQTGIMSVLIFSLVLPSISSANKTSPADACNKAQTAILIEQKAQRKAEAWAKEKENILAEIQDLKHREEWLDFQEKKYKGYIKEEEGIIEELVRKKKEFERIQMNLEPYLEQVYEKLKSFVETDLHFLPEERQKRLSFLRDSLDDYRVGLSEKLRRILEALQVEANYGRSIEKNDGIIDLKGEKVEVSFLRIGRLAQFFLSTDHTKVGYLDRNTNKWELIDIKYAQEVEKAIDMAERKRAIELVDLPVGRWKAALEKQEKDHLRMETRLQKGAQ